MEYKLNLTLFYVLAVILQAYSQPDFPKQVNDKMNCYMLDNIQEKLYIQTNSNQYFPGDTIWFKASLVNAINHKPLGLESFYYIDLISPENKLVSHQLYPLEGGFADGFLTLDGKLLSGRYKLLAYTSSMRNYSTDFLFQKPITLLPKTTERTKWEFNSRVVPFPEGDSVFVKMYVRSNKGRGVTGDVDVRLQLARGTMLGATCPVTNNEGIFSFFVPDTLKLPVALLTVQQKGKTGESEKYRIPLSAQKPDLQFLPEGGELVAGQENRVAFRCVDTDGNPRHVKGELIDTHGQRITLFASEYQGMGSLKFSPQLGQAYLARISYRDSIFYYGLPEVGKDAYSLKILEQNRDSIRLAMLKSSDETAGYLLVAHCRGMIQFMGSGILQVGRQEVTIPTSGFTEGIVSFTLFIDRIPRAERLVYLDNGKEIEFTLNKELTDENLNMPRDFVLRASYRDGSPLKGNFSLLAWDTGLENSIDSLENIRNYLRFSSDLQGEVLANTEVFNAVDPERDRKRDLMLLTSGWRRFNWNDVMSHSEKVKAFEPESELFAKGKVYRMTTGKPVPKNFEVAMVLKSKKLIHIDKTYTDEEGNFRFVLPAFTDSANLILQTKNRWDQQKDYIIDLKTNLEHLRLDAHSFDKISKSGMTPLILNKPAIIPVAEGKIAEGHTSKSSNPALLRKPRVDNYYFPGKDTFLIEEVEARSNFLNRRDSMISQSGQPDVVIESAQLKKLTEERAWYSNLWDLLSDQVPGLQITQAPYQPWRVNNYNLVIADQWDIANVKADESKVEAATKNGVPEQVARRDPGNFNEIGSQAVYFRVADNPDGYLYIFVDHDFLNHSGVPLFDLLSDMDPGEIESINFIAKPKNYDISMDAGDMAVNVSLDIVSNNLPGEGDHSIGNLFPNQMEFMEKVQRGSAPPAFLFITTKSKKGVFYSPTKGLQNLFITGLTPEREFYIPKYSTKNGSEMAEKRRKTIFWQPQLITDSAGVARISFNPGVETENMTIQVQGISQDGVSGSAVFRLKQTENSGENREEQPVAAQKKNQAKNESINPYLKFGLYYGTVTDSESGESIAFADLTATTPYYHESTNDAGEFFLSSDRLGERREMMVSCPGYQSQKLQVPVATDSVLRICLIKALVSAAVSSTQTLGLVRNAIRESRKLYASKESFQGYNRETVTIDDQVYGIYEMAFNYSNAGYPGSPTALRFETVKFKNMEDKMGHRLLMLKPNHRSLFYPLKDDVVGTSPDFWQLETTGNFTYEEIGQVEYDGELCYKIRFKQKDNLVVALQSGILYIGSETAAIRYASWRTSPDKQKYLSYASYLQSNPMEYDVQVEDDYHETSYCLVDGQLYLRGTNRKMQILVNRQNFLEFENRLSVVGKSQRNYKDISNRNTDMLIEEGKGKHLLVKDAVYRIEPWINLGIVKPEDKLFREAEFLHDISQNF